MARLIRLILVAAFIISAVTPFVPVFAQTIPTPQEKCQALGGTFHDTQPGNPNSEKYCYFVPPSWNGDLVVFAHGYVDPRLPVDIPYDQLVLPDGTSIPGIITGLHFAFATTSYEKTGLAVKEGVKDILGLVTYFKATVGGANHVYLIGASEGGLVTTLAVEQNPSVFSGGVATCGPIGDFKQQVNYWGDFRVVFDYLFPSLLPPTAVNVPTAAWMNWGLKNGSDLSFAVAAMLSNPANQSLVAQLLKITHAPIDSSDVVNSTASTILGILSYNILATDEARAELVSPAPVNLASNQGQPFDNTNPFRLYFGSSNDLKLNLKVARFTADPNAIKEINKNYQTTGVLKVPLVTLHDTGDPIVPYWHELLYALKVLGNNSLGKYVGIPISRYGHCQFTATEALVAFYVMVFKATNQLMPVSDAFAELPQAVDQQQFQQMVDQYTQSSTATAIYLPVVR